MAEEDFNPQLVEQVVEQWTGHRRRGFFFPSEGSKVAVVYVEASGPSVAIINTKLGEIEALADGFEKRVWTPSALAGKVPKVIVTATVHKDGTTPS